MNSPKFLIVVALFIFSPSVAFAAPVALPEDRTITDNAGRKIEATILSQAGDSVRFLRKSDGKIFNFPVAKLSREDQLWLNPLAEKPVVEQEKPTPAPSEPAPPKPKPKHKKPVKAEPLRPVLPKPKTPKPISSKEILAEQLARGMVPPPKGWDALQTTIKFKDGRSISGYVYDLKEGQFWYAGMDMIQKVAPLSGLTPLSRIAIENWRNRSKSTASPSMTFVVGDKKIHASVLRADKEQVTFLAESGELMENVAISQLDEMGRNFISEWSAGRWKPDKWEWAVPADFAAVKPFSENGKALVMKGGKWGVIDLTGKFVEPPSFENLKEFRDSSNLKVSENGKWGLMLENGKLAIPPAWEEVGDMHHGMIPVRSEGKWGYAEEGGKLVIPCKWDDAWRFSSVGTAVVTLNGKRGFVNRSGEVIVKPEWDGAILHTPEGIGAVRRDRGWALVDRDGRVLCDPVWNFRWNDRRFELGYIPARPIDESGGTVFLGIDGKPGTIPKLREGVCLARQPGPFLGELTHFRKFNLKDEAGTPIVARLIYETSGGMTAVRIGNKYAFADQHGIVGEARWDQVGQYSQGLAAAVNFEASGFERTGDIARWPWQFIDPEGNTVIPVKAGRSYSIDTSKQPWAPSFANGRAYIRGAKWNEKLWVNATGKQHTENLLSDAPLGASFPKQVERQRKLGLIDLAGNVIFKVEYDELRFIDPETVLLKKGGMGQVWDVHGEMIIEGKIHSAVPLPNHSGFKVHIGGNYNIHWKDWTPVLPEEQESLTFIDCYGQDLIFREGSKEAPKAWWRADFKTRKLHRFEGASRIYWVKSLADHQRIWLQDEVTKRWHFCSVDGTRLGLEMATQPDAWFFDEGFGIMWEDAKCYFVNKDGKRLNSEQWDDASVFKNGLVAVKKDGQWGFIDTNGKKVIACKYDEVGDFFIASTDEEAKAPLLAAVCKSGKWGYINEKGHLVIPLVGDRQGNWDGRWRKNLDGEGTIYLWSKENSSAYWDAQGNKIEKFYKEPEKTENSFAGMWTVSKSSRGLQGLVDDSGKVALEQEWRGMAWIAPGVIAVRGEYTAGLFSPEKGWLFQDDDQRRIRRSNRSSRLDLSVRRNGFVMIEETPKWGYARWKNLVAVDGLIAHYALDGNTKDTGGMENHSIYENTQWTDDKHGNPNSAIFMDGSEEFVSCPLQIGGLIMPQVTIIAWARADSRGKFRHMIGMHHSRAIQIAGGWSARGKGGRWGLFGHRKLEVGEWVFLAVSYDEDTQDATLRVNDEIFESKGNSFRGSSSFLLGGNGGHAPFKGAIDEVRVYDRVLSKDELDELYQQFLTGHAK